MSLEISNIEELIVKLNNEVKNQNKTSIEVNEITNNLIDNINKLREKTIESEKEIIKIKQMIGDGQQGLNNFKSWIISINNSIEEVVLMINSIHKIIEKTSILAMNAAIEAAHAQEYGSGFSIVADEVRKLSEQEDENIKQIDTNLQKIQNEIINTNESVEKTINTISTILHTTLSFSDFQNFINSQIDSIANDGNKVMDIINKSLELTSILNNLSGIISNHVDNINSNLAEVKGRIDSNDSNVKKINDQIEMIKSSIESFIEIESTNKILIEKLDEMISIFKLPLTSDANHELTDKPGFELDNKMNNQLIDTPSIDKTL